MFLRVIDRWTGKQARGRWEEEEEYMGCKGEKKKKKKKKRKEEKRKKIKVGGGGWWRGVGDVVDREECVAVGVAAVIGWKIHSVAACLVPRKTPKEE